MVADYDEASIKSEKGYGGEGSRDVSRICTSTEEITKGDSWSIKES